MVGGAGSAVRDAVRGAVRRTKAKAGSRNKGGDRDKAEGKGKEYGKGKGTGKISHTPGSYVHRRMGSCLAPVRVIHVWLAGR